ncbi:rod shape-determining protein MreD [Chachezhania antarctica]|uniref:rod shape-determining protein MreD n=1 Tax=Chachezhania antarctica TaxID=2340860 RepID=UPI000EAD503D|nr:rod shape-determining protein MreD [Chachezhania antarctica]|tara:strand:+ start:2128 stop:2667 length:540 start_codon:yes stop_codon:yes gene_type:complete
MEPISPARIWFFRFCYAGVALLILFAQLLPLDTAPRSWAAPDVLMCLTMAWCVRWPAYAPVWLVALVALIADLLLQRPPGLMALLIVAGSEYLRYRATGPNQSGAVIEWMSAALVMGAIFIVYRLVLGMLGVGQAQVGLMLTQILGTILVYPLVALLCRVALGDPAPVASETERKASRI